MVLDNVCVVLYFLAQLLRETLKTDTLWQEVSSLIVDYHQTTLFHGT